MNNFLKKASVVSLIFITGLICFKALKIYSFEKKVLVDWEVKRKTILNNIPHLRKALKNLKGVAFFSSEFGSENATEFVYSLIPSKIIEVDTYLEKFAAKFVRKLSIEKLIKQNDIDWVNFDLNWMSELLKYSLFRPNRIEPGSDPSKYKQLEDLDVALVELSRLRLVHGFRVGQLGSSLEEVVHLAKLLMSAGNRQYSMAAVSILEDSLLIVDYFKSKTNIDLSGLVGINAANLESFKIVAFYYPGTIGLRAPLNWIVEAPKIASSAFLQCPAIIDAVESGGMARPFLRKAYPKHFEAIAFLKEKWKARCKINNLDTLWAGRSPWHNHIKNSIQDRTISDNLINGPSRWLFGKWLLRIIGHVIYDVSSVVPYTISDVDLSSLEGSG